MHSFRFRATVAVLLMVGVASFIVTTRYVSTPAGPLAFAEETQNTVDTSPASTAADIVTTRSSDLALPDAAPASAAPVTPTSSGRPPTIESATAAPATTALPATTTAPTTAAPSTTAAPATTSPANAAPTTVAPATAAPTTAAPTTAAPTTAAPTTVAPATTTPPSAGSADSHSVALLNQLRDNLGLQPLTLDNEMSRFALDWSQEMSSSGFRHSSGPYAENIVWYSNDRLTAQQAAASFHESWVNSPGHYANMTNSRWTSVGVGLYLDEGGWWGTHVFR